MATGESSLSILRNFYAFIDVLYTEQEEDGRESS